MSSAAATALRLFKHKGRQFTLRSVVVTTNTSTSIPTTTATNQVVWGLEAGGAQTAIAETLVQRGDLIVFLASTDEDGAAVIPTRSAQVVDGGILWTVEQVERVRPGSEVVLWEVLLRQ